MMSPVVPFLYLPHFLTYPGSQVAHAGGRIDMSGLEEALEIMAPNPLSLYIDALPGPGIPASRSILPQDEGGCLILNRVGTR